MPPSKAPSKRRHASMPPKLCVRPERVATRPQLVVMKEIHRDGRIFLITQFDGSSTLMYVAKRMETKIWNWFPVR